MNDNTCDCCEGTQKLTPMATANRPGLDALSYRVGTHAAFLATMKARLSTMAMEVLPAQAGSGNATSTQTGAIYPLRGLTTREANDPAIALLDSWATVADVLTFYQERIANEGYLRTATERRSVLELARRAMAEQLREREVFSTPDAVKHYLQLHLARRQHEIFAVLFLDSQNRLIALEELFRGTLTQTSVYPREVVLRALHHHAAAVVLAHNHPSGTVSPSRADEALTQTLKAALALVDVRVPDHVIVAPGQALSLSLIHI